tara:strand:+ start:1082 stop:1201 length:120 start_codon:yes stop_codon:yes gene_type:complete
MVLTGGREGGGLGEGGGGGEGDSTLRDIIELVLAAPAAT